MSIPKPSAVSVISDVVLAIGVDFEKYSDSLLPLLPKLLRPDEVYNVKQRVNES